MTPLLAGLFFVAQAVSSGLAPAPESPQLVRVRPAEAGPAVVASFDVRGLHAIALEELDPRALPKVGDAFDSSLLPIFANELRFALHRRGHLNAEVSGPVVTESDDGVRIEVQVSEGVPYRLGILNIHDTVVFSPDELAAHSSLKHGDLVTPSGIQEVIHDVEGVYKAQGYAQVDVEVVPTLHDVAEGDTEGIVDIDLAVDEGERYVMGEITFADRSGLDMRAALASISPREGEPFDEGKLWRSLLQVAEASGLDNTYYPDMNVVYDRQTRRANVTFFGFRRYAKSAP